VAGHAGNLVIGKLGPHTVAAMQGRVHYYEGHSMDTVVFPARVLVKLGCSRLVITNAAGGLGEGLKPGDLALISDHLNMLGTNPLRGPNFEDLGPRFPDMTNLYDPALRALAKTAAARLGVTLKEGVYAAMLGPSYETPAEIRMMGVLGASMVGMSTVPEAIVAVHAGMRVLGLSIVTDVCFPDSLKPGNIEEIIAVANEAEPKLRKIVLGILAQEAGGA
jgi:purine-nucleoside phosphorylase